MNTQITNLLNAYVANIGVSYIKIHNLHWNVVGSQFKAVHEYLETLYDAFADVLDESAELLRINGQRPLASMREYLEVATVKELESRDYDVKEVIKIVLSDMELLKAQALDLRAKATDTDQFDVVNLMEDNLKEYNKTIWFLSVMLK